MSGDSESSNKRQANSPYFHMAESNHPIAVSNSNNPTSLPQGDQLHPSPIASYHSQQHLIDGPHLTSFTHQPQLITPSDHSRAHIGDQFPLLPTSSGQDHPLPQFLMPQPKLHAQHNPHHIYYQREDVSGHTTFPQGVIENYDPLEVLDTDTSASITHRFAQNPNILYQQPHTQLPQSGQENVAAISLNQYDPNYISTISSNDFTSQYGHVSTPHFLQLQPQLPQHVVNWAGQSRNPELHSQAQLHTPALVGVDLSSSYIGGHQRASYPGQFSRENFRTMQYRTPLNVMEPSTSEKMFRTNIGLTWPLSGHNYQKLIESIRRVTNMSINPFLLGLLHDFRFGIPIDDFYNCIYNNDDNSFNFPLNTDRKVDTSLVKDTKSADASIKTLYEVLSLVKKIKTNPSASLEGDEIRPLNFHELLRNFLAIKILNDMLIEVPDTSKPRNPPINDSIIPRLSIYKTYFIICQLLISRYPSNSNTYQEQQKIVLSQSKVGKLIKLVYPELKIKRLGARGDSKYTYLGVRWNESLISESIKEMCNNNDLKSLLLIHSESDVVNTLITPVRNTELVSSLPSIQGDSSADVNSLIEDESDEKSLKKRKPSHKSIKPPSSNFRDTHVKRGASLNTQIGGTSSSTENRCNDSELIPFVYSSSLSFINPQSKYPGLFESPEVSLVGTSCSTAAGSWFSDAKRNIYIRYPFLGSSVSSILRDIAIQASESSIKEDYLLNYVTSNLLRLYMQHQFGQQQEVRKAHYLKFEMHVFLALILEFLPYFLLLRTKPGKDDIPGDSISLPRNEAFVEYMKINVQHLSENLVLRYSEVFSLRDDKSGGSHEEILEDNLANWRKFLNVLRSMLQLNELLTTFICFSPANRLEMASDFKQLESYDTNYRNISFLGVTLDSIQQDERRETNNKSKMFEENIVLHNLLAVLLSYNVQALLVDVKSIAIFFTYYCANYLSGKRFTGNLNKDITLSHKSSGNELTKSSVEDLRNSPINASGQYDKVSVSDTRAVIVSDLLQLIHTNLLTSELKNKYSILVCNSFFNSLYDDMVQYWRFIYRKSMVQPGEQQSKQPVSDFKKEDSGNFGIASTKMGLGVPGTDIQSGHYMISQPTQAIDTGEDNATQTLQKVQRCWLFVTFLRSYTLLLGEIVGLQNVLQQE